jgi:hypothetical protein
VQEPLDPILHETYAARIAEAFADPTTVTDADLTALLNATGFNNERTFQSIIALSRFEKGRVAEIRLYPIDLGYGLPHSRQRRASPRLIREGAPDPGAARRDLGALWDPDLDPEQRWHHPFRSAIEARSLRATGTP